MLLASDSDRSSNPTTDLHFSKKSKKFRHSKQKIPNLKSSDSLAERDQQEEEQRILALDWQICKTVLGFTLLSFAINPWLTTPSAKSKPCKN